MPNGGAVQLLARSTNFHPWYFRLGTRTQPNGAVKYDVVISDKQSRTISSTSVRKYEVVRDSNNGEWRLVFETASGTTYGVNIGRNADFDTEAGL
jgi:hypothetical protein